MNNTKALNPQKYPPKKSKKVVEDFDLRMAETKARQKKLIHK